MGSGSFFGFFLDLLFLVPFLLAVRAVFPHPVVFRTASTLAGLYLLYAQAPRFVPFFFGYWVVVWLLQHLAARAERQPRGAFAKLALAGAIVIPLAPMMAWKLVPAYFVPSLNELAAKLLWAAAPGVGFADALVGIVVPLGLSFATFRALDLLLKIYLGLLPPLSLDRVLYYGFFPPILALGPIAEYEEVKADKPWSRWPKAGDVAVGVFRIMLGIAKIFAVGMLLERGSAMLWQGGEASVGESWAALLLYGLFFYANFSGYSDVAIGAARVLGLKLKENFANPFLKTNPQAFWNAWHMSLTRWTQRYVFVPLGGMRAGRHYVAAFASIMVIALWHGLALPMVVFGIFHGTIVVVHRWLTERRRLGGKKPGPESWYGHVLKSALVFFYVSLSLPLLVLDSGQALAFYGHLFLGTSM
jgi:D-alanyl-lipoteichoic acid acyltransferase DltB (MBOAT superfamily)